MNAISLRRLLGISVVALLAGCAGPSGQPSPIGALPQSPAANATRGDLLYVSDTETSDVYVYSYPDGKSKGRLTGFTDPAGECVDSGGNVFITNTGANDILEYAHGGTQPIATLKDAGYFPIGCSIDPITGDLAVTNSSTTGSGQGDVIIFRHARGAPTGNYTDSQINEMLLCGYDASGDLFVDGLTSGSGFVFAELRRGSKTFTNISLNQSIENGGGVQWDGKYIAVGDQATNTIYRFSVTGSKGTEEGSTPLTGAQEVFQFWIAGTKVIGPDAEASDVGIWQYPAGGSPIKKIDHLYVPLGATLSKAP